MATLQEIEAELARRNAKNASSATPSLSEIDAEILRRQAGAQGESYAPRAAGLAARVGIQGVYGAVTGIPALAADALAGYSNLVSTYITNPAMQFVQEKTGIETPRARIFPSMLATQQMQQNARDLATLAGTPVPVTENEKLFDKVGTAVVEAGGLGGLGPRLGTAGRELAAAPVTSMLMAGSGAGAAEYGRQQGASPGQQVALGLLGGAAPAVVTGSVPATTAVAKNIIRGPNAIGMQRNIATLREAGIPPSVGTTAESPRAAMIEGGLANTPVSRGPIFAQREAEALAAQKQLDSLVSKLAPGGADTMTAGRAISSAVTGTYIPRARDVSRKLYAAVDAAIPADTRLNLPKFTTVLKEVTTPLRGAERTSGQFINPFLRELSTNIARDLGIPDLGRVASVRPTYEVVADLRSRLGAKLSDPSLIADIPRGELKRLYKALMDDLEVGLSTNPDAARTLKRANNFTRSLHERVDALESVVNKNMPESVFNAVLQNSSEGGTMLKTVFRSIPENERRLVAGTIISRLGKSRPSQQGFDGDMFSPETFLTRWNQLSPTIRNEITAQMPESVRKSYNALGEAMDRIRNVNASMPNPSGTGVNTSFFALAGGVGGGTADFAMRGDPTLLGAVAATSGGLNISARLMTNPKFVNWLAQQTKLPANALSGQITLLRTMMGKDEDELLRDDVDTFINSVYGKQ